MDNYPDGSNTKDSPWNRKDSTEWEKCGNEKEPCQQCGEWNFLDENNICEVCHDQ